MLLKLRYHGLLSNFCFIFRLRRYMKGKCVLNVAGPFMTTNGRAVQVDPG
jgi:hypothetical protein